MNIKRHYGIDSFTWQRICTFYDNKCLSCHEQLTSEKLSVDHVRPVSMGGNNTVRNYQPLCMDCNREKGNKIIDYRWDKGKVLLDYLMGGPKINQPSIFEERQDIIEESEHTVKSIADAVVKSLEFDFGPLAEALTILAENQAELNQRIEHLERIFPSSN